MDRISRRSQGVEGVRFGDLRIGSLLFADDVVLLASSDRDLQLSLDRFAAECKAAGMRISTSKSESMVLNWKMVECTLRVGDEILPQVEDRVVPIPIPVSEIAPILLKMLASVSATTGVQAPIRYHEFKYLGVHLGLHPPLTREGRMEREINRRIGAASAVMRTLHRSVVFLPSPMVMSFG
ncbi:hypothetical protein N1851_019881 [Merluccius polli]|uniref:Reverse transcriptase domain-containing protein n=1 Tax=Merluccius polli TaxID=89951 RepID=A0AA47MLN9_MERPO|nr:hypothetical protein N1851_019881 [Merluccius polli]